MRDIVFGLAVGGAVLFVAWQGFLVYCARCAKRSREEYERAFPGGCYICSHHAYGQREFGIDRSSLRVALSLSPLTGSSVNVTRSISST